MITPLSLDLVEYIVDQSGSVDILADGLQRDHRGRPFNKQLLRTLLIGWLLTNQEQGTMRIKDVHKVLTTRLDRDSQQRLGIVVSRHGIDQAINRSPLDAMVRRLEDGLGYGTGTHPHLDNAERTRRERVITAFSDALLDMFNTGFTSTSYAIDGSGIWTWGKSRRRRPNVDQLNKDGDANPDANIPESDPDAAWGSKTSKDGSPESVFGYHLHALVRVPGKTSKGKQQPVEDEPRLVHRIGITPANADIVDVSLDMIDRLNNSATSNGPANITDLIVDSHYHYKKVGRWIKQLLNRGIRQHHDLRTDETKFMSYQQMRFFGGDAHCPATPDRLADLTPLPPDPSPEHIVEFRSVNDEREQFAMVRHTAVNAAGQVRVKCPALEGKVGCPHRTGTVQAATQHGLPVLNAADVKFDDMPACCTQQGVKITLPDEILKHAQPYFWGSKAWRSEYNKRTYVESLFGNMKNDASENVRRGMHRHVGIAFNHLHLSLAAANFNLRTLRKWHQDTGKGDTANPLLANVAVQTSNVKRPTRGTRRPRWAA